MKIHKGDTVLIISEENSLFLSRSAIRSGSTASAKYGKTNFISSRACPSSRCHALKANRVKKSGTAGTLPSQIAFAL